MGHVKLQGWGKRKNLLPKGSKADLGQFSLWSLLWEFIWHPSYPRCFLSSSEHEAKKGKS